MSDWGGPLEAISTAVLAAVTTALAWFTFRLWRSTKDLVGEGQETARRQLRAYIAVPGPRLRNLQMGSPANALVEIKNFGATPAYSFVPSIATGIAKTFDELPPLIERDTRSGHLAPGATVTVNAFSEFTVTEANLAAIKKGELTVFVHGIVRYIDAFGDAHFTRFRLQTAGTISVIGDTRLAASPEGNVTDDELAIDVAASDTEGGSGPSRLRSPVTGRRCHIAALACDAIGTFLIFMEARRVDATFGYLNVSFDSRIAIPGYGSWIYHSGVAGFACLLAGIILTVIALSLE